MTEPTIDRTELITSIRSDLGHGWHPIDKIAQVVRTNTDVVITNASLARILVDLTKDGLIKQRSGYATTRRWMVPYVAPDPE